jgi:tRNA (adenine57-N1/adenine58-N1)-methyltransferase catalytic subunit
VTGVLSPGDRVRFIDGKGRHYLDTLSEAGEFHTHKGVVFHADLLGRPEGILCRSSMGETYTVLRPTYEDTVLLQPRGAQVIYPKDSAHLMVMADVGPGLRVFEAGVGSGALSTALLRAGCEVVGYELREDFANRARSNVTDFLGTSALERYHVHLRDAYHGIDEAHGPFDRMLLDLPEPWRLVPHAEEVLHPGGILAAYTPSTVQVGTLREALATRRWTDQRTLEVLVRTWHVEGQAIRPDHRMVAHTAFLTSARLLAPSSANPTPRPKKPKPPTLDLPDSPSLGDQEPPGGVR